MLIAKRRKKEIFKKIDLIPDNILEITIFLIIYLAGDKLIFEITH